MEFNNSKNRELGSFFRLKREQMDPVKLGINDCSRRRTPGLRREELAEMAGVGLSWYTWLEQGRNIAVSNKILVKLSRIFNLSNEEIFYVFSLANRAIPSYLLTPPDISPLIERFLNGLTYSPAFILDRYYNIIFWNNAFNKVLFNIESKPVEDRNLIKLAFTDDEFKSKCSDYESVLEDITSNFRLAFSQSENDKIFENLISELLKKSHLFSQFWRRHSIATNTNRTKAVIHPVLGKLIFEHTSYFLADSRNIQLSMYVESPATGSETELKIMNYIDNLL
ncbi:helix-turn-helix domain-containing protein [Klebsiella oxytoca]|nr:helix-turn-helix domain-containing protein [Klebsiella oxytoca]